MIVVVFRAKVRELDATYRSMADHLRELALSEFGCLEFHCLSEGNDEIAISYWPSESHVQRWKAHPDHVRAQQLGRQSWYESFSVHVATVTRSYDSRRGDDSHSHG